MTKAIKPIAILCLSLALCAVFAGLIGSRSYGPDAYLASGLAAAVVALSGSLALLLASIPTDPMVRLNALLGGVLIRMSLPLMALAFVPAAMPRLAAAGMAGNLVIFFLIGLLIETPLLLRFVAPTPATSQAATDTHI